MDDLISRQMAIDAIFGRSHEIIKMRIGNLPSAQLERPRGQWIPSFDGKFTGGAYWFECSKCKRIVPEVRNGGWNFCPNCGADMRGK